MRDSFQHSFRATKLDAELLSTPFGVQTNWHVIAGAQSCGKTTLIDQLADIAMLPYLSSTDSRFSVTASGPEMRPLQPSSMSGSPATTVP